MRSVFMLLGVGGLLCAFSAGCKGDRGLVASPGGSPPGAFGEVKSTDVAQGGPPPVYVIPDVVGQDHGQGADDSGGTFQEQWASLANGNWNTCMALCTTPSDCVNDSISPDVAFDEDNWACQDGVCAYLGCSSDQECYESYLGVSGDWECHDTGVGMSFCFRTVLCETPVDCVVGYWKHPDAAPANSDENNWACQDGECRYLGCQTDDECAAVEVADEEYQCSDVLGGGIIGWADGCRKVCSAPADCIPKHIGEPHPVEDEDNWGCQDGLCYYLGCVSDAECEHPWVFGPYDAPATCANFFGL